MITGNCECGHISYEVDGDVSDFSHCHCSQCRRLHGAAYATFAGVARSTLSFTSGKTAVRIYKSSADHERIFCPNCGSNIMVILEDEPDVYYLSMGAVNGDPSLPPGYHIYVGSKAPWHEINDELPKYEAEPPD
jgi:hypothetical protein